MEGTSCILRIRSNSVDSIVRDVSVSEDVWIRGERQLCLLLPPSWPSAESSGRWGSFAEAPGPQSKEARGQGGGLHHVMCPFMMGV